MLNIQLSAYKYCLARCSERGGSLHCVLRCKTDWKIYKSILARRTRKPHGCVPECFSLLDYVPNHYCMHTLKLITKGTRYIETTQYKEIQIVSVFSQFSKFAIAPVPHLLQSYKKTTLMYKN